MDRWSKDVERYLKSGRIHLQATEKYYKSLTLDEAIRQAALGQTPNKSGTKINMDSHQRRIGVEACKAGLKEILKNYKQALNKCKSFEDIFNITQKISKEYVRLGELWSYDTALRIGFNKGVHPKEVYIQCGVVIGVKKVLGVKYNGDRKLPRSRFPGSIQRLKAYEAENFLCKLGKSKSIC